MQHQYDDGRRYPDGSYYQAGCPTPRAATELRGRVDADVCVIGAGFTGLSAALHLAERGYSVVVLERHEPGFGASGRNGGQLGSGQRCDIMTLERRFGRDRAKLFWQLAEEAKDSYQNKVAIVDADPSRLAALLVS